MAVHMTEDVQAAGGRATGPHSVSELACDADVVQGAHAAFINMASANGAMEQLLRDLSSRGCHITIVTQLPFLDTLYDALPDDRTHIIVGYNRAENILALAAMLRPVPQVSHESDGGGAANELQHITRQVSAIAQRLVELSGESDSVRYDGYAHESGSDYRGQPANFENGLTDAKRKAKPLTASAVRDILRARRMRDRFFEGGLFADPAWDMLLDMTAAHLDESQVSVSSLCIAACVPPTTALRWIKVMTEQGIFERRADNADGRRVFIALSDHARKAMRDYMQAIQEQGLAAL